MAERGVQTVKKYLIKYLLDYKYNDFKIEESILRFISSYNNVPSTVTLKSPFEMLFSYKPKTRTNLLNKKVLNNEVKYKNKKVAFNLNKNVYYIQEQQTICYL